MLSPSQRTPHSLTVHQHNSWTALYYSSTLGQYDPGHSMALAVTFVYTRLGGCKKKTKYIKEKKSKKSKKKKKKEKQEQKKENN